MSERDVKISSIVLAVLVVGEFVYFIYKSPEEWKALLTLLVGILIVTGACGYGVLAGARANEEQRKRMEREREQNRGSQ